MSRTEMPNIVVAPFIEGAVAHPASRSVVEVINPSTGQDLLSVPMGAMRMWIGQSENHLWRASSTVTRDMAARDIEDDVAAGTI